MKKFADFVQERLRKEGLDSGPVLSLSKTDRYVMYKAGPVLSVNVSFSSRGFFWKGGLAINGISI